MKLKTITNGPRWIRYPLFYVFLNNVYFVLTGVKVSENLISAVITGTFVFLFWIYRKIKYDEQNVYFISGNRKTIVPFETITELKKSKSKINSERFWILKFKNEEGAIKTRRFFHGIFQGGPKDFHKNVKALNPSLNIQFTTNYSQMVDSWNDMKERKRKKKEKKQKEAK